MLTKNNHFFMNKNLAYEYISIIHNNPAIIVLKKAQFLQDEMVFIYRLDAYTEYLLTFEEINFRIYQQKLLQTGSENM